MELPKCDFKENLAEVGSEQEAGRVPEVLHSLWLLSLGRRLKGRKPHGICTPNISSNGALIQTVVKKGLFSSSSDKIHRALT